MEKEKSQKNSTEDSSNDDEIAQQFVDALNSGLEEDA